MAAYTFPTLTGHNNMPDSSKYSITLEDPAMTAETEGGYKFSRARHTRMPRETWRVTYTGISDANATTLRSFYKLVRGGSASFDWTEPDSGDVVEVRFKGAPTFTYVGMGETKLWDCSFEVEEL